ncbi:helix-turn-helix domain-containing protein [Streptomyces sp. NPDC060031]|uniref:helix-turn-helix domain-containing protein n=1 Tax=Streptomyces sp. NPDC060031 TaxID=3347043 RepID=UPI0036C092D7
MRRLSPDAQEDLRLRVVAALESGRVVTYGRAAEMFGVSERSVGSWWRAFKAQGHCMIEICPGSSGEAEGL